MGELPYMVVCLAEVCNNVRWKPTRRHRQTHTSKNPIQANDADRRYRRPHQPIRNLWPFYSKITEASLKITTNCPQCLCLFVEFCVFLGTCKVHRQREKVCESVCVSACHCATLTHTHTHSLFMNVCECLPKTYRSNKGHFSVCGCLCVYTSKTHTHWTPVIPFQHMLWVWPVSQGALPHDWEPRQPQTIKQSKRWIAGVIWNVIHGV